MATLYSIFTLYRICSLKQFINTFNSNCQLGPRYEGQLTLMAEPIPPSGQSSSYSRTTLSSSSSTDRRAETDRKVITTRIAVAHYFIGRLRRRVPNILGATSSQPTLPLHELPPARLVIHRQTSSAVVLCLVRYTHLTLHIVKPPDGTIGHHHSITVK